MIKLLDVTLRDGGYKNNFYFNSYIYEKITDTLINKAGINYIEIGYKNGPLKSMANIGPTGLCTKNYIEKLASICSPERFCVIYHPKNINTDGLKELKDLGIKFLRCVLLLTNRDLGLDHIAAAKKLGFLISANITRASQLDINIIKSAARECVDSGADIIYLADSNGALLPSVVGNLFSELKMAIGKNAEMGFHAHDNLSMAFANSLEAIKAGATFIDSSIMGVGKGAGNLKTEIISAYLSTFQLANSYNSEIILELADHLVSVDDVFRSTYSLNDMLSGLFNLSMDDTKDILSLSAKNFWNAAEIIRSKREQN